MLEALFILALLIWLPVLFYSVERQGFLLLIIWLLVAPVAVNVLTKPGTNPFFKSATDQSVLEVQSGKRLEAYLSDTEGTVKLMDLLNPSRILLGVFLLVFLGNAVLKGRPLGPFDSTEKFAFIFALMLVASAIFQSRRTLFGLRIGADAFIIPFLAYFCVRRLVTNRAHLHQLIRAVVYTGVFILFVCFVERFTKPGLYSRLSGPFNDPSALQVFMSFIFFVAFCDSLGGWVLSNDKRLLPSAIRRCVLCLAPLVIVLTWARATWLGFIAAFAVFVTLSWRAVPRSLGIATVGVALVSIPVITATYVTTGMETIVKERVTGRTGTIYSRLGAWSLIVQEFLKAPLFGIGMNNLRDVLAATRIRIEGVKSETHAHNSLLSILGEQGAIGLLAYLGVVGSIFQLGGRIYREGRFSRDRLPGAVVIGIMVAYLVPALFANSLQLPHIHHVYVYSFIGAIAGAYASRSAATTDPYGIKQLWPMRTDVNERQETTA
jgi:O-antigen ligase